MLLSEICQALFLSVKHEDILWYYWGEKMEQQLSGLTCLEISECRGTNIFSLPALTEAVRNRDHAPANLATKLRDVLVPCENYYLCHRRGKRLWLSHFKLLLQCLNLSHRWLWVWTTMVGLAVSKIKLPCSCLYWKSCYKGCVSKL